MKEWDICVPTDQLAEAGQVFRQADDYYEPSAPPPPVPKSLRHVSPTFKSREADFHLLLTPSRWQFLDPARPGTCIERDSRHGLLPYPRQPHFARALLVLQNGADVADLIDGMDLDAQWGEAHLDFDDLQARALPFLEALNEDMMTGGALDRTGLPLLSTNNLDFRRRWNDIVEKKPMRIEPLKQGRYKTPWRRIQDDSDPRTQNRPVQ